MMKKKLLFIIPAFLFFISGIITSCNSPQKENNEAETEIEVEIKEGAEEFRNDIEELDANDPDFKVEFDREVDEFDQKLDEWGREIEEAGDEVSAETRETYNNMRRELDEMGNNTDRWANATEEELEDWGAEIEKDFNDFRNNVREWVE